MITMGIAGIKFRTILLANFVTCGVEFVSCAGFTYIPPLLRKAGHSEWSMALTMGLGPLLGFIIVPSLGEASDNTKSKYGRRRPFIFLLCATAATTLFLVPYSRLISTGTGNRIILTILVILFDFSSQAALTPIEALLSDMGKSLGAVATDHIFQVYSFMVGFGGIFGYLITSIDWKDYQFPEWLQTDTQEERVFNISIFVFILSLVISLHSVREQPYKGAIRVRLDSKSDILATEELSPCVQFPVETFPVMKQALYNIAPTGIKRVLNLPIALRRLCICQFFSWCAVMSYNVFFTDFVGEGVFGGDPSASAGDELNKRYDDGVRVGSWGLLVHCISCCLLSLVKDRVQQIKGIGARGLLFVTMVLFGVSVLLMTLVTSPSWILSLSVFPGLILATLMSTPFALVNKYHDKHELYLWDSQPASGSLGVGPRGIGTDLAILDSMYFLAEFSLAVIDSCFVVLIGSSYAYMYATGVFAAISACLMLNIIVTESDALAARARYVSAHDPPGGLGDNTV